MAKSLAFGLAATAVFVSPPGLPAEVTTSAAARLGKALFFDTRLSADGKIACATCHQPEKAFQDGRATAQGAFGQVGRRNTPSLLNVVSQRTLFWDGRRSGLSEQALDPLLNAREHGLQSSEHLLELLRSLPEYAPLLAAAADGAGAGTNKAAPSKVELIGRALEAFELQLVDGESAFERYLFRGDANALTSSAERGWRLFSGRARCSTCHVVGSQAPVQFTDHDFHALPTTGHHFGPRLATIVNRFLALRRSGQSVDQILIVEDDLAELGRFAVTEEPSDIGAFKTPSLRNVMLTAPYMHDGSVATIQEALDLEIYYRGTRDGRPLILTDSEKADVLAFLNSLTSFVPLRSPPS